MKEKPILFSTPMVKAILEGRKTMTRRIINPQPKKLDNGMYSLFGAAWTESYRPIPCMYGHSLSTRNKYGQVGDRLWVRETWSPCGDVNRRDHIGFHVIYKADSEKAIGTYGCVKWKPSIFMPRWASRIMLEITDVRIELLQDITEQDAINEGVRSFMYDGCGVYENYCLGEDTWCNSAKASFNSLWMSINGPESWNLNPYVWVISLKKTN